MLSTAACTIPSISPHAKKARIGTRRAHGQSIGAAASVGPPAGAPRSRAPSGRQMTATATATTAADIAAAARQPAVAATRGRTIAEAMPPSVSPICLMPIAMPRSGAGKRSMMALPSAGLTTLHPAPAKNRQKRNAGNAGAAAPSARPTAPTISPPSRLGRTPTRSVSRPAGSEKSSPPR